MSRADFASETGVSRETLEKLDVYADLLVRWTSRINLVSKTTLEELWARHFLDSAQLTRYVAAPSTWTDLGSGGGFPGAVVAILNPATHITLIESDQRKAAFLRTVARETETPFNVVPLRIEDAEPCSSDVVSARALAPLTLLLKYAHRHLGRGGTCLLLKGQGLDQEMPEALETWSFDCEKYPSLTHPDAVILKIGELQRV